MSLGQSRIDYDSGSMGFKNDGNIYTGSIDIPTSLASGEKRVVTSAPLTIAAQPEFCLFFAKFTEYYDVLYATGVGAQWYPLNVGAQFAAGLSVTAPAGSAGPLNYGINPLLNGTSVSVQLTIINPYSNAITIAPQTINWAFVGYSLAG
jgi:hypothetical protein